MRGVFGDIRHALRLYRRTPLSSLIVILVLAIGMTFVSAFLSLYVYLALKPFPGIEAGNRLITLAQTDEEQYSTIPMRFTERMQEEVTALEGVVGLGIAWNLSLDRSDETVKLEYASRGFFDVLRPELAFGRGFEPAEHDIEAGPVVVLSDRYWREQYDARTDVIGETIEIRPRQQSENEPEPIAFRIVGVMVPDLDGVTGNEIDLWAPFERVLPLVFNYGPNVSAEQMRQQAYLTNLGRLAPGASIRGLLGEIEARIASENEDLGLSAGFRIDAVAGVVTDIGLQRAVKRHMRLFLAGSALLALVAATNVSLFLLARAPGRRRELAIRIAVGAPLNRIARQLATESALLIAAATGLSIWFSVWFVSLFGGADILRSAGWRDANLLDWRVVLTVGIFVLLLTSFVAMTPILGVRRRGPMAGGVSIAARASLPQRIAGTVQLAIAGSLGGAAIAFIWFLAAMLLGDPGYEVEDRYVVRFFPYVVAANGRITFQPMNTALVEAERSREIVEAVPGVQAMTISSLVPGGTSTLPTRRVRDPADPLREIEFASFSIDDRYVAVLGLTLLYGSAPAANDIGAVLVNQRFAQAFFGRDNVVGETLELADVGGTQSTITGVLEDMSFVHPAAAVEPLLLTNQPDSRFGLIQAVIASTLTTGELRKELTARYDSGELELGQPNVQPLWQLRLQVLAADIARAVVTILTAGLVVILAAVGFYGIQRYLVGASRREYAIRAALGAGPAALGRLLYGRGLMLGLPGLTVGALLAFIGVSWLRDEFLSRAISAWVVSGAVVLALTLLMLAASVGPARQARRTQPAALLRED